MRRIAKLISARNNPLLFQQKLEWAASMAINPKHFYLIRHRDLGALICAGRERRLFPELMYFQCIDFGQFCQVTSIWIASRKEIFRQFEGT
jgi:hypothetical protein